MNYKQYLNKKNKIIVQRNLSFFVILLVLVSNVYLSRKVYNATPKIMLIPLCDTTKIMEFDGDVISDSYLFGWASSLLSDLLTVNRNNLKHKNDIFMKFSTNSELLKNVVNKNAEKIIRDGVSTVFYPKNFTVDHEAKTVLVEGTFMAYFGRDKAPIVQDKKYLIGWIVAATGCLLVDSLEEKTNESN